jgi:flagellar hook-basal body complex protein FliE
MAIESLTSSLRGTTSLLTGTRTDEAGGAQGGEGFAGTIATILGEANAEQAAASNTIKDLVVDGRGSIHDAMIAVGKADSSFRLLMEMRNRLIEGVNQLLDTRL